MAKSRPRPRTKRTMRGRGQVIPINVLNDDVLLAIFDFCVANAEHPLLKDFNLKISMVESVMKAWQSLVHVCQRWRSLVFQSPRRLNLRLRIRCTPDCTPTRHTLDIWPALPLVVAGYFTLSGKDNVIAALKQNSRVCQVDLSCMGHQWELDEVLALMQVSFPELTDLWLQSYLGPVVPDSFLGGSAPRLQHVDLEGISFPGLPKLLLSANHLVDFKLWNTPHSGYISPEAMVALISVLSSLETLSLGFPSPQSRPDLESRSPPPLKRFILPALDKFRFEGVTEYLEDLVTFIDAPQLDFFYINFVGQSDFDTPRLAQFINRTPRLRAFDEAHVQFNYTTASVKLPAGSGALDISFSQRGIDWQLLSIERVCTSSLHPLSTVEDLYIEDYSRGNDGIQVENTLWLELLLPFTAVKNLYLSKKFVPGIAAALQESVGDRITEALPSLQNIFLERSGYNIGHWQSVAARQLSGHPIAISVWDK